MDYDVCIVGAGVAGALTAYKIASTGKKVMLMDAGPRFDYLSEERYGRVKRGENPWDWIIPERDLYEESSTPNIGLNHNRVKGVGGSTLKWLGSAERLMPKDFKMQSLFGIGVDWPVTYSDMQNWYYEAEQELGVAGKNTPDAPPRENPFPLPPHPVSFTDKKYFIPAFNKLGLSAGPVPLAINSRDYNNRPKCELYSTCSPMCPLHAKYTATAHVIKAESTGNVTVKPNCDVTRVNVGSKRKIESVKYINEEGSVKEQKARVFILAAGGIENPRLLLLSADRDYYQNGLANSSNQVGRNYMTHPSVRPKGTMHKRIGSHKTQFDTACSWTLYNHKNLPSVGNVMLLTILGPKPAAIAINSNLLGNELLKKVRQEYGFELGISVIGEMLPRPENCIRLSDFLTDCYGDPAPSINMQLSNLDKKSLLNGVKISSKILKEMGASNIRHNGFTAIGSHIIGTTRMGDDPNNSVCDRWGKCHDLDNLYIAGGSLFPTSGVSAPTLTIAALALRMADYIGRNL